jgi:transposase
MITPEKWMDIKLLQQQGLSQREIAKRSGHARNTVAKLLHQKTPKPFDKPQRVSCLDPYKPHLTARWEEYALSAPRLCAEIQAQGYTGSLNLVQRFLKTFKDQKRVAKKATVRFETPPGQQAQADWAHVGEDTKGKIYAFLIVLGFSRTLYVEFTRSMDVPTLIRAQQNAFEAFGGVPQCVLYDNMAQVRLPNGEFNPYFADFAAHFGFVVKTHRPYRPRTKGKVERMVDYLKDNFLNGRTFNGLEDLAQQGRLWREDANKRVHATTGERPADLLPREKLTPLDPSKPYFLARRYDRLVDAEGHVRIEKTRYSVPPEYIDQSVEVRVGEHTLRIRAGGLVIAEHKLDKPGATVDHPEHVAAMWKQTLAKSNPAPVPHADFTKEPSICVPSLSYYEEVAQ